jgi:hypothetical protein
LDFFILLRDAHFFKNDSFAGESMIFGGCLAGFFCLCISLPICQIVCLAVCLFNAFENRTSKIAY